MYMLCHSDEDVSHHDYGRLGRRKRSSGAINTDQSHDTPRHKGTPTVAPILAASARETCVRVGLRRERESLEIRLKFYQRVDLSLCVSFLGGIYPSSLFLRLVPKNSSSSP